MRLSGQESWPYWDTRLSGALMVFCDDKPLDTNAVFAADEEAGTCWRYKRDADFPFRASTVSKCTGRIAIILKPNATQEQQELFAQMQAAQIDAFK